MPIHPLPQFEADMRQADLEAYERLRAPTSIVVRFGSMKMVGEFPYSGDAKPGCGSKIVVRTHRGTELGEMLTSTCPNAGCSKSVTRQQMLQYIENSGGSDYPFFTEGRALRIATVEDLNRQSALDETRPGLLRAARAAVAEMALPMKIVDSEPILGGERITFFFTAEDRVDFRDLVGRLAKEFSTRIELRQVGARDEARLIADYERCGQHCCCKQFLKVLKPVSMKSAKIQKATLDPLKISGRCGRLMCCLRYEDETYDDLRKRLPKMKSRVGTPEGPGIVIDTQILTQLALVLLDGQEKRIAVPIEELTEPGEAVAPSPARPPARDDRRDRPGRPGGPDARRPRPDDGRSNDRGRADGAPPGDPLRGMDPAQVERRGRDGERKAPEERSRQQQQDDYRERSRREMNARAAADLLRPDGPRAPRIDAPPPGAPGAPGAPGSGPDPTTPTGEGEAPRRKKKRRRRKRRGDGPPSGAGGDGGAGGSPGSSPPPVPPPIG